MDFERGDGANVGEVGEVGEAGSCGGRDESTEEAAMAQGLGRCDY